MVALHRYLVVATLASLATAQSASTGSVVGSTVNSTTSTTSSTSSSVSTTLSVSTTTSSTTSSVPTTTTTTVPPTTTTTSVAPTTTSASTTKASTTASSTSSITTSSPSTTPSSPTVISTTSSQISSTETSSTTAATSSSTTPSTTSSIPPSATTPSTSIASSSSSISSVSSSTSSTAARSSSAAAATSTYTYSSVSSSVSFKQTVYSTSEVIVTTAPDGQTSQRTDYTIIQTTIPATTLYATTLITSTQSPTGAAGLQADGFGSSGSSGLSTGAKAGIGAGVGIVVITAAIIGALYAMRRRKRDRIADADRYTPSLGPSMVGGGFFAGGMAKTHSNYTESEPHGGRSPQMYEPNPLARYAQPGVATHRTSLPGNSRGGASDISSVSGTDPNAYRPGPGMPAVPEQQYRPNAEELPGNNNHYLNPNVGVEIGGNPFNNNNNHRDGGETPSVYSDDGNNPNTNNQGQAQYRDGPQHQPSVRQASPAALELSGENTLVGSMSNSSAGQGYRGMDPEAPYHTRAQLTKPSAQQRQFDPSQNF